MNRSYSQNPVFPQNYFELASILSHGSSDFRGVTVPCSWYSIYKLFNLEFEFQEMKTMLI